MHIPFPLLITLASLAATITSSGTPANNEDIKSLTARAINPIPHPQGLNPCGTFSPGDDMGLCGAWYTAMYSITPISKTTMMTATATVTVDASKKMKTLTGTRERN
ncbi:MAG: hypothetical protein Q9222_006133 [Ikaeria aurantiellina]